jgi:hypothetical protein
MNKIIATAGLILAFTTTLRAQPQVNVQPVPGEKKVNVLIDGKLFTSYIWPESIKKPVFGRWLLQAVTR